jgi:ATP-binding cassette subfamily B protein
MSLPGLGEEIAGLVRQYPALRNVTLRFLEPLGTPEEVRMTEPAPAVETHGGVQIDLAGVTILASGQTILQDVTLHIAAGEHVGIVGASGAGKSSLVGLLLGWHRPAIGSLCVDGAPLDATGLERLRCVTAWIDPQVQVWNRSLLDNLLYGNPADTDGLDTVLTTAGLTNVLSQLPEGLQTRLGEGGAQVSGGEGQRVRTGRAMLRSGVRLGLLDEPARGLDHECRRQLLASVRACWKDATLLVVTHDVRDVLTFDRVLVLEHGQVVEDGVPWELYTESTSRYRALCDAEDAVREQTWGHAVQRHLRLANGRVEEKA